MKREGVLGATLRLCIGVTTGLCALVCLFSTTTYASFDHSGILADPLTALDTTRVFKTEFTIPEKILEPPTLSSDDIKKVLDDEESRIAPDFRIPDGIEPQVRFWLSVYTQYTTHHMVLADSREQIIWDVVDLRQLYKTSKSAAAYEIVSKHRIKQAVAKVRSTLAYLASHRNIKTPTPDQAHILKVIQESGTKTPIAQLAHHVRSQTGQRDNVMRGLVAAEPFFAKMEMIFKEMGVPLELTRLPLVESSFNIKAYSRVGAAGAWQFMPASAREYMKISNGLDERLSPLKATVAAGRLLSRNYKMLGNWALAVIAYNHGYRGLPHLTQKQGRDFSRIAHLFSSCRGACSGKKSPLGFASRNYYAEFLAMLHAEAYRDMFYGEPPHVTSNAIAFQRLERPLSGLAIAAEKGVPIRDFMVFNPDVRDMKRLLPKGFWVALPSGDDDVAILASRRHPRARVAQAPITVDSHGGNAAGIAGEALPGDGNQSELIRAYDVHNSRLRNNKL